MNVRVLSLNSVQICEKILILKSEWSDLTTLNLNPGNN